VTPTPIRLDAHGAPTATQACECFTTPWIPPASSNRLGTPTHHSQLTPKQLHPSTAKAEPSLRAVTEGDGEDEVNGSEQNGVEESESIEV
jgi:hypothetical protein